MKRKITAWLTAGLLGLGLAVVTASPASAVQDTQAPEVCYVDETHTEVTYDLQRSDWVAPVAATIEAGWYTEPDDNAPTASDTGLTFTADGTKATGLRTTVSYPLADVTGPSITGDDFFHERLVVDVDGEPFGAGHWRNDYLSLNFTLGGIYVNTPASGWQTLTLEEVKGLFTGTVTSVGFHLDSNAPAGTSAFVDGHVVPSTPDHYTDWFVVSSGQGVALPDGRADGEQFQTDGLYRYVVTGSVEVTERVEAECPDETIYLPAPVQVDQCGPEADPFNSFILPEVDGVVYGVYNYTGATGTGWLADPANNYGWESGDSWLVIAGPDDFGFFDDQPVEVEDSDYGVDSRGNIGWWFPAFTDVACEVPPTEEPAVVVPAAVVTPTAAALADTGFDVSPLLGLAAGGLALAGAVLMAARRGHGAHRSK